MVNPFEAGSSVLFKFIEIMETICEKAFKRALSQMAAKIHKHEWAKEAHSNSQ